MTTDFSSRPMWQVGGGPAGREYPATFLDHDVALIGPGEWKWPDDRYVWDSGLSKNDQTMIDRFVNEVKMNDIFVLRHGQSKFRAVGIVASEYEHLEEFDDVKGWNLSHARRVRWQRVPDDQVAFDTRVFGGMPSRFSSVNLPEVREVASHVLQSLDNNRALKNLPSKKAPIGRLPRELREVVDEIMDLRSWYYKIEEDKNRPKEQDIVAHMVVPFLRALHWPAERIAIGWNKIDVAAFSKLPKNAENCQLLIEVKRLDAGLDFARNQVEQYRKGINSQCDVVATDGIRYELYEPGGNSLDAYANLGNLKRPALDLFDRMRVRYKS